MKTIKTFFSFRGGIFFAICAVLLSSSGCAALLPREHEQINNLPFASIQDAAKAYDAVNPGYTTLPQLKKLGFNPAWPGTKIIDYIATRDMYVGPNPSITIQKLPLGVQECINTKGTCETSISPYDVKNSKAEGNFLLNKFGVRETTHITGSEGLFIFSYAPCKDVPDVAACKVDPAATVVLYKRLTDYSPNIDKTQKKVDPFGIVSNIGGIIVGTGRRFVP